MIVELTRAEVIKAIREATISQFFFEDSVSNATPISKCGACAAGAVMRRCLRLTTMRVDADNHLQAVVRRGRYSSEGDVEAETKAERSLNAISVAFEQAYCLAGKSSHSAKLKTARAAAVKLVKTRFPARIQIDINGLKPRRGARVVK